LCNVRLLFGGGRGMIGGTSFCLLVFVGGVCEVRDWMFRVVVWRSGEWG